MILFILLSVALAAASLAVLVYRGPVVAHVTDVATAAVAVTRPTRGLVIGLALLVAVVAIGGYGLVGSPRLIPVSPDAPPGPGPAADAQVAVLQRRAEEHPDDAAGWYQAAQAQLEVGHSPQAVADYRRTLALRPTDPDVLADLADVLAGAANGNFAGEPMQLVARALATAPDHVKALALQGSDAMARRDFRTALASWDHAIRVARPGDPIAAFLKQQLDAMREMATQSRAGASAPAGH